MQAESDSKIYYGWWIAFIAFLTLCVSNGMTLTAPTVFDEVMPAELSAISGQDVSLGALKFRDTLMLLTAGFLGIFAGALADRFGVKPLMIAGLLMLAGANFLYSQVQTLLHVYGVHLLYGVLLTCCGLIINVMLVSRWFVRNRGLAIGIALAGTSVGNAVLGPLYASLLQFGDWRQVFQWTALIPLALVPVVFFMVRDNPPADTGGAAGREAAAAAKVGYTLREALTSWNFWALAIVAMCTFYSILAMGTHTYKAMRDAGYTDMVASSGLFILFIGGLVGKLISGWLAETFGRKLILMTSLTLTFGGALCLLAAMVYQNAALIWAGLTLFGFGWGGIYTLIQLLCADLFGLKALGKIIGAITVLDTLGGGAGPFVTGLLYDATGGYVTPFALISGLLATALVMAATLRIEPVVAPAAEGGDGPTAERREPAAAG